MKLPLAIVFSVGLLGISCWAEEQAKPAATETNTVATGKPTIQFDKTTYDFGKTSNVTSVTGTFTFQNVGAGVLQVKKPAPSCGCTVAKVNPDVLKPGEKGELVFTMNVGNAHGVAQKSITVPSNDPEHPSIQLTVRAEVTHAYEVSPPAINVGNITDGGVTNFTVHVKRNDGAKLAIDHITASSPQIQTRFETVTNSNDQAADVFVTLEGKGEPRRFGENIQIFVAGQTVPVSSVAIHGRIVGDVSVIPERIGWGFGDIARVAASPRVDALLTRSVRISASKPNETLEVRDPESTRKDMKLEVVTLTPGKDYQVVVKLPELPKQSERGTITIHTNLASVPVVQVPFVITVVQR